MPDDKTIGFIGLGVMGEPICEAIDAGSGDAYFPVIAKPIAGRSVIPGREANCGAQLRT